MDEEDVELMDYAKELKLLEKNNELLDQIKSRCEIQNHWLVEILNVLKGEKQQKVSKDPETEEIEKSEPKILEEVDSKSDLTLINIGIKVETDKAILVIDNTTKKVAWIPKKAITMNKPLTIANWFKDKLEWQEDKSW